MRTMFELEMMAVQRQQELAEELDRTYGGRVPRGGSFREVVAEALIALAVWLAPSTRAAVAGQAAQAAHGARA